MNRTARHGKSGPKGRRRPPAPPRAHVPSVVAEPAVSAHGTGSEFEPIDLGGESGEA